ncbi:hypothetical protein GCM10023257_68050 [Streptomyces hyderabadensis]|uniref:Uncharacterized protein n=1 Tax=Streptomyces hyderabadensis TaxID=598549 RepID=A0ABP9IWM3_9ACTN
MRTEVGRVEPWGGGRRPPVVVLAAHQRAPFRRHRGTHVARVPRVPPVRSSEGAALAERRRFPLTVAFRPPRGRASDEDLAAHGHQGWYTGRSWGTICDKPQTYGCVTFDWEFPFPG